MATYKEIQKWVKQNYGFVPKTCWIADVKQQAGLQVRKAHNRKGDGRVCPCPQGKVEPICAAMSHFGMIE
jgi:hypothetical protein